ncbi:hypothetical protein ACHHV8_03225 [Paenibacillus sp. TAB 01]|uniref:hypothetical protein n=1 Tax=Paenibacillus sp. TAB 01 TaxID=3368988 RepID=UPI003750FED7
MADKKHYSGSTGVVILRFDGGDYAIVSENHSGDIPSACLALLVPNAALPGRAAEAIDCLTSDGFRVVAFNQVGTDDLVYTLVKSGR